MRFLNQEKVLAQTIIDVTAGQYECLAINVRGTNIGGQQLVTDDISKITLRRKEGGGDNPVECTPKQLRVYQNMVDGNYATESAAGAAFDFTMYIDSGRPGEENARIIPPGEDWVIELEFNATALAKISGTAFVTLRGLDTLAKAKYTLCFTQVDVVGVNDEEPDVKFRTVDKILGFLYDANGATVDEIRARDSRGEICRWRVKDLNHWSNKVNKLETVDTSFSYFDRSRGRNILDIVGTKPEMTLKFGAAGAGTVKLMFVHAKFDEANLIRSQNAADSFAAKEINNRGTGSNTVQVIAHLSGRGGAKNPASQLKEDLRKS